MVSLSKKFPEFYSSTESVISNTIESIIADNLYNWDEDYITQDILKKLRTNLKSVKIQYGQKNFIHIQSEFLKLNKKYNAETKYGDIAIVVNLSYDDGSIIEGVALIEAKRIYEDSNKFNAVKTEQLERIQKNAPHAHLILYDYKRIDYDDNFKNYLSFKKSSILPPTIPLYSSLVPINLAREFNIYNRQLYRFSTTFSHQLSHRYIFGLDLEFDRDIIDIAKGYRRESLPNNIVKLSVKHSSIKIAEDIELSLPDVNPEFFTNLE